MLKKNNTYHMKHVRGHKKISWILNVAKQRRALLNFVAVIHNVHHVSRRYIKKEWFCNDVIFWPSNFLTLQEEACNAYVEGVAG